MHRSRLAHASRVAALDENELKRRYECLLATIHSRMKLGSPTLPVSIHDAFRSPIASLRVRIQVIFTGFENIRRK